MPTTIATITTITRPDLHAALDNADARGLAEQVHARGLSVLDGAALGQSCLALEVEHVQDLAVFLVALARVLPERVADRLADATRQDGVVVYWPGVVLAGADGCPELTAAQRADARAAAELFTSVS